MIKKTVLILTTGVVLYSSISYTSSSEAKELPQVTVTAVDRQFTRDMTYVIDDGLVQMKTLEYDCSVDDLINLLEEEDGVRYLCTNRLDVDIDEYHVIELVSKTNNVMVRSESIPFETVYEESADLYVGTEEISVEGVDGLKDVHFEEIAVAGEAMVNKTLTETTVTEPVTEVILVGTKEEEKEEVVATTKHSSVPSQGAWHGDYSYALDMTATAYTAGAESTGKNPGDPAYGITASGIPVAHGVVAVDPNVIPLGTQLYVEGYGYAVAADTGGAIKGNKIDLFYHDLGEALEFGRQTVRVYVL